ncbi:MAG: sulfate reduction electron transfer complex DsrMKJOP subunit DsrO [Candidatus Promineifilaceae bacterium]|jgi:Fe-S-cluster-containing dehydrogenase component
MTDKNLERRDFLKLGAAGLAVLAAGPALANKAFNSIGTERASESEEKSPHSWAMVIDQEKCVGCGHCIKACKAYNDVSPDIQWTRLVEGKKLGDKQTFIPIPCMHCEDAPCTHVCLVGATKARPDGIVMMDYDKCIGCRYCEVACPYGVRSFNWEAFEGENPVVPAWGQPEVPRRPRGVAEKCSFCYQRIDRGLELGLTPGVDQAATPACVVACPMKARTFGDLNDPESEVSKILATRASYRLREGLGTNPRVYYLPAHEETSEELSA